MMIRFACADCGETLDLFGICPFADPERARTERAPVNCGHSVVENTRTLRALLNAGDPPAMPRTAVFARGVNV